MSLATLNGNPVHRAAISMPVRGAWTADVEVEASVLVDGEAVTLAAPGLTLRGTAYRSGIFAARGGVRIVGGAGGLATELRAASYRRIQLRHALDDIARESGEAISPTSDTAVLSTFVERWTRPRGPASQAIGSLLDLAPGASWRVLDDGTIWVGALTWPVFGGLVQVLDEGPAAGRLTLAGDQSTGLRPGALLDDRRVTRVTHTIEPAAVRTEVEYTRDESHSSIDRLLRAVAQTVENIMRRVRFHARRVGLTAGASSGGAVSVRLDSAEMPGDDAIPMCLGLPGFTVSVPAGTRCAVAYEDGDPTKPTVVGFGHGSTVTEVAFDGGTKGVARVDDEADAGMLLVTSASGGTPVLSIAYLDGTIPSAARDAAYAAAQIAAAPLSASVQRFDLRAVIVQGNPKLKA